MEASIRIKDFDSVDLCYIGMVYVLKHALGTATNEVTVYVTEICDDYTVEKKNLTNHTVRCRNGFLGRVS